MGINIAIDGPSGAGKSTIARDLAKKMGYTYIDTGALYRAVGLYMKRKNALYDKGKIEDEIENCIVRIEMENKVQKVYLEDEDVTDKIRDNEISMAASKVSAIPKVRQYLLEYQRSLAKDKDVIMDGRDIGTVVLPNADIKIFLSASVAKRAQRRYYQMKNKGKEVDYNSIKKQIQRRDYQDAKRQNAPLKKPKDALYFNNTYLTRWQTVSKLKHIIENKLKESGKNI